MKYNTTHEQIIGNQRITTYISMTVTPVEETPKSDETTNTEDANYVDALIEAAIYNHYPPIATPSEFKRVFARALSEYEAFKGTPAEKAAMTVAYALAVKTPEFENALIEAEIARHSPTIAKGAEFKAVYDKALELFYTEMVDKLTPEIALYAVKAAVAIVCPEKRHPVTPTPAELISDVIAERWPLNTLSTTNELKIAYRARAIFNEFAGSERDKAVKAVEHAHKELVEELAAKIDSVVDQEKAKLIAEAITSYPSHKNWTHKQWQQVSKLAHSNYPTYNFNSPVEKATHAVREAAIILGLSK